MASEALLFPGATELTLLAGKWFTFWAVGVRLFLAGVSQVFRPQFTSEGILGVKDPDAKVIVREVGFGNLSMGTLGLLSLAMPVGSCRLRSSVASIVDWPGLDISFARAEISKSRRRSSPTC